MQQAPRTRRHSWQTWALLAVLLTGFAVRLHRLGTESLWYDETVSVYLARQPIPDLMAHTAGDIHPPGYYLLLHGWLRLTGTRPGLEFVAAFPSVWFGLLLMALAVRLTKRIAPAARLVTAALLAVHPYHIAYAQEVRMYTVGGALAMLCLLAALRLADAPHDRRAWLLYVLAAVAGLYTLYYLAFLLLPLSLWLLVRLARRGAVAPWLLAHGAMLALYAPWLPVVWRQVTEPPVPPWRGSVSPATMLAEAVTAQTAGPSLPGGAPAIVAALLGAALYLWGLRALNSRDRWPLALATCGPFLLIAAASSVTPLYHVRYLFTYAAPFTAVVAVGVAALPRRWPVLPALALLVALSAVSLQRFWAAPAFRPDDHRAAVAFLHDRWRPGDAILLHAGYAYTAFLTYWPDAVGWRGRLTDFTAAETTGAPVVLQAGTVDGAPSLGWGLPTSDFYAMPRAAAEAALGRLFAAAPRVWVYRIYDTVTDPTGALRDWLAQHGTLFDDQVFMGEATMRVQGWLTRPDMAAAVPPDATPAGTLLGGVAELVAHSTPTEAAAGGPLDAVLYWRLPQATAQTLATSLRLVSPDGTVWAQQDEPPLGPLARTPTWPAATVIRQPLRLAVPDGTPAGAYAAQLVLYDAATGEPLPPEIALGTVQVQPGAPAACPAWPRAGIRFGLLQLARADVAPVPYTAGTAIPVEFHWRACADVPDAAARTPVLALVDAQNQTVAAAPLPLSIAGEWPNGQALRQRGALPLPDGLAAGTYRLTLRVVDAADRPVPLAQLLPIGQRTETTLATVQVMARAIAAHAPDGRIVQGPFNRP